MTPDQNGTAIDPTLAEFAVSVVSFYMDNVAADVVLSQRAVLERFKPSGFALEQILTARSHGAAIDDFLAHSNCDLLVLLDIDCVPLHAHSLPNLAARAARGAVAGCVQRANHIQNDAHLYVGPFCMAFTKRLWEDLKRPSFEPTARGDVGEEFTYCYETSGSAVDLLWPSFVETAHWDLTDGRRFGRNTEYDGMFLHAFGIRDRTNQGRFVQRCREIVGVASDTDRRGCPGSGRPVTSLG
jgi:hypothetical protein